MKTGKHQSIWIDVLTLEQAEALERISVDPIQQIDEEIRLLDWRERQMMLRIRDIKNGLTEKQPGNPCKFMMKRLVKKRLLLCHAVEEPEYRVIDDILSMKRR